MSKKATESLLHKMNNLLGISDSYQAPDAMMRFLESDDHNHFFRKMIQAFDYNLGEEWFNDYFEDEHADRKNNKQDFTPTSISQLMAELLGEGNGIIYEPAAGTGSTIIQHWWNERIKSAPWNYNPLSTIYICEELSNKTIPFLLFNIMVRGMNAVVIHGNSLTRECKEVYHCLNVDNEPMGFSDLVRLDHCERTEKMFNIKFMNDKGE